MNMGSIIRITDDIWITPHLAKSFDEGKIVAITLTGIKPGMMNVEYKTPPAPIPDRYSGFEYVDMEELCRE